MQKFLLSLLFLFVGVIPSATAQKNSLEERYALFGVAFYNLENLFDTLHDAGKNDFEYLPTGKNKWNTRKYKAKLHNLSTVISQLCTDRLPHVGAAVVGVSEVENSNVLRDLVNEPELKSRNFQFVHHDGPDRRGVECALLYNPRFFRVESSMLVPFYYKSAEQPDVDLGFYTDENNQVIPYTDFLRGDTTHITRGFLCVTGILGGCRVTFIVNHWPSRAAASPARERAGYQLYRLKEALMKQDPETHVIIMGDFNDDPKNKSIAKELRCKSAKANASKATDLYNPWYDQLYRNGQGTLFYDGKWNLFDQILISGNLLDGDTHHLQFHDYAVFLRDWLFVQEGRSKARPLRTFDGGVWKNGYSDHLPTQIYLKKALK